MIFGQSDSLSVVEIRLGNCNKIDDAWIVRASRVPRDQSSPDDRKRTSQVGVIRKSIPPVTIDDSSSMARCAISSEMSGRA